ncbi:MAG: hypothetical protein LUQ36_01575 [Methanoregula sp.]|nr:hypothetical protein [Methanoregula sp.]
MQDAGTMKEGTVPVPLYPPALSDDDVTPVRGLSHPGSKLAGVNRP